MDMDKLKVPIDCPYFDFKWPFDDKKGYQCFEVEPGEWCPLGNLEGHEYVYCCAVAALYWRKKYGEIGEHELCETDRLDEAVEAREQSNLWQAAAFEGDEP